MGLSLLIFLRFRDDEHSDEDEKEEDDSPIPQVDSSTSISNSNPTSLAEAIDQRKLGQGSWFKSYKSLTSTENNALNELGRHFQSLPVMLVKINGQGGQVFRRFQEELKASWYVLRAMNKGLMKSKKADAAEAREVLSESLDFLDVWLNEHFSPQQQLPGAFATMAELFQDPVIKFLMGERSVKLLVVQIRSIGKQFSTLANKSASSIYNWKPGSNPNNAGSRGKNGQGRGGKRSGGEKHNNEQDKGQKSNFKKVKYGEGSD